MKKFWEDLEEAYRAGCGPGSASERLICRFGGFWRVIPSFEDFGQRHS